MFLSLVRVAVGSTLALSVGTFVARELKRRFERKETVNSNECELCFQELSGAVRSMKCCGSKFHRDCLRAYVQSLDDCPIKCPSAQRCKKIVSLDEAERRDYEVPISTETLYYCHCCDSIVENTKPRVLPCTHRFCVGCIRQCMMGKAIMGEEPRCPMEGCGLLVPEELHDSIMRME